MSVQTHAGPVALDASDFQGITNGVTWGLKVRYTSTPDGSGVLAVVIAEKSPSGWDFKGLAVSDVEAAVAAAGALAFIAAVLIPAVNAWLKQRFGGADGGGTQPPEPVLPPAVTDLDQAIKSLRITADADGVPQVSL